MTTRPEDGAAMQSDCLAMLALPDLLLDAGVPFELTPKQRLFRIGEAPAHMYCVSGGEVQLTRCGPDGSEVVLQRVRQGFVAEASLDSAAYHCDAVAAESTRGRHFPRELFRQCLELDSAFRKRWLDHLYCEVRRTRAQSERLSLRRAADRIRHYLVSDGVDCAVTLVQSRKVWAAELGLSHEALYRTLARLEREGVLVIEGNSLRLVSAPNG